MKKHNILSLMVSLVLLLFLGINGYAQNPLWSLPPNYVKPGSIIPPGPLPVPNSTIAPYGGYTGLASQTCSNAMADAQGNLSFFVLNNSLYDGAGREIGQMVTQSQDFVLDGGSELCIIPKPGDCSNYYVFGSTHQSNIFTPTYQDHYPMYIEYAANTPFNTPGIGNSYMGSVSYLANMYNNSSLPFIPNNQPGKIPESYFAASPMRNDNSHLLFVEWGNLIGRYRVDAQGVTFEDTMRLMRGTVANMTIYGVGGNAYYYKPTGELELHLLDDGTYLLATSIPVYRQTAGTYSNDVLIYHLDANGDLINNGFTALSYFCVPSAGFNQMVNIKGLEFSPDGSKLYIAHTTNLSNYPNAIEFYDFNNPTAGIQSLSLPNNPNYSADDYQSTQIELGQDGKLYFTGEDASNPGTANRLSTLSNPNTPNSIYWNYNAQTISYTATYSKYHTQGIASKIYTLPDQIDGMDYAARFTQNLQCCIDSRDYGMTTYNTAGTDIWNDASDINGLTLVGNTVTVQNELRIKAGSVVTIKNMTFKFAPGARVVIERGSNGQPAGKLIMDNTTFTQDAQCTSDIYWLGVEVQGNGNLPQLSVSNTSQGILMMKNNSVIEYAQIGAVASQRIVQWTQPAPNNLTMLTAQYDPSAGGGIIQASNSTFRNNFVDVKFQPYHYLTTGGNWPQNFSTFSNCTFITTSSLANYPILGTGPTHAELTDVKGIRFVSCDFSNTTPYSNFATSRGVGILSRNAIYSANSNCGGLNCTINNGTFTGLYFGIRAFSTGFPTLTVDKQDFINNTYGIDLEGPDYATVTNNNFEVSRKPANFFGSTYGLYLNACTGYRVENNHFTSFSDPNISAPNANTYGVVVNNSGTSDNEIYRNTFIELKVGIQAQGINGSAPVNPYPNNVGLRWKCNTFEKEIYTADLAVSSGRIAYQQGFVTLQGDPIYDYRATPAGNKFSHSHHNSQNDIMVSETVYPLIPTIHYVHHSDFVTTPELNFYNANKVALEVASINVGGTNTLVTFDNTKSCPSKINGGIVFPGGVVVAGQIHHLLHLKTDSLKIVIAQKESLIDGGNTADLLSEIAMQSSSNIKNTLMVASPYLSDTVLTSFLGVNPPNGHIKEVVIANSPVSETVYAAVDAMNLPHGIQKQIDNAQEGISARTYLNNEIAYLRATRSDLINERVRQFIFDTISPSPFDSIAVILKTEGISLNNKKRLFDTYCAMPDSGRATQTRDTIVQMGDAGNFSQLADIQLEMLSCTCPGGLNAHPNLINGLQAISGDANDRISAVKAQCMLSLVSDSLFLPVVEDINTGGTQSMNLSNTGSMNDEAAPSAIAIYPNPSNNSSQVTIALVSQDETLRNARVEVYSISGQWILSRDFEGETKSLSLQPGELNQGIYFVKLISEGTILETKKLLVER